MSRGARGTRAALLAACLALVGSGGASAQAEPAEEATLCVPPAEAGDASPVVAARAGRMVPILADSSDPALGCTFPVDMATEPFTGKTQRRIVFTDPGLPGLITQVGIFETDLSRRDVRRIAGKRGVETAGRLPAGPSTVVVVEHDPIPADVGLNVFTNLDDRPFNDAPVPPGGPDLPLGGVDGGYTVFGDRLFVTDFRGGGEYYTGSVDRFPFAAIATPEQTSFLIPRAGTGTTVTPFAFSGDAFHYIDFLPNGALPVSGRVPLFPACGPAQEVVHLPLMMGDTPLSASTDWVSACFPLGKSLADLISPSFVGSEPLKVAVTLVSFDGSADERTQETSADVSLGQENIYVRFPSGLLRYGYHRDVGVSFDSTGDPILDTILAAASLSIDEYLVPVAVDASEGLMQSLDACQPPGEQVLDQVG